MSEVLKNQGITDTNTELFKLQDNVRVGLLAISTAALLLGPKRAAQVALICEIVVMLVGLTYIVKKNYIDDPAVQAMLSDAWAVVAKQNENVHEWVSKFLEEKFGKV